MKRLSAKLLLLTGSVALLFFSACTSKHNKKQEPVKRPNILIAISDDQSFAHTSINGDKLVKTPNFDRVAKAGILFTNCIAGSPGCAPSRSSMLTGRYPWQNEHAGQHASEYPQKFVTFPDELENAGYAIGITGKGCGPFNWRASGRKRNPAGPELNGIKYKKEDPQGPPAKGIKNTNYFANFKKFLENKNADKPFYFWYGAHEPHRFFEKGSGLREGINPDIADIPGFLPNHPEVRSDMADYALEIEWSDKHLGMILDHLEEIGELENTIVIVTADNGMAFPGAKANCYEYGIHVPMAISYPAGFPSNRKVDDLISFTDIAPTLLEMTNIKPEKMMAMSGESILDILKSKKSGKINQKRDFVMSSRERHSSSRWNNLGYPQRALRTDRYLYIRNFKPERWPAGAPQMLKADGTLDKMHGRRREKDGNYNYAYTDIDACPTKDVLIEERNKPEMKEYFLYSMGRKRPAEEFFDIVEDPYCLNNLADDSKYKETLNDLRSKMKAYCTKTGDPRFVGDTPDIFETYKRYSHIRSFPKADWAK
jgi:uncharacterized sulfatase